MDKKHFTIYIKSKCPFCVDAREILWENRVSHTIHIMDEDLEALDILKESYAHPTVPIVLLGEGEKQELIGGYTDLENYLNDV